MLSEYDGGIGKDGEWSTPRVLEVQFQEIEGTDLEQFRNTRTEAILELRNIEYRTGEVVELYSNVVLRRLPLLSVVRAGAAAHRACICRGRIIMWVYWYRRSARRAR